MQVAKGLIVADPWIGYILDGSKTWEMRSTKTSVRGPFALIRKGTGAIFGVATLVDAGQAMTPAELLATVDKHRIPTEMIASGEVAKWNTPWVLADIRRLLTPVPYDHPNGAVTWVNLADGVSRAISAQLGQLTDASVSASASKPPMLPIEPNGRPEGMLITPSTSAGRLLLQTQLSDGNISNHHFYMRGHLDRFPDDIVGGPNKTAKAAKDAIVDWGGASPVVTDIDGNKQVFRARGWVRQFFEATDACPGDWVLVEETDPYRYRVSLKKP